MANLLTALSADVPESVDVSLDAGAVAIRFNHGGVFAGQYLAAGRLDGSVSVIDFETRTVISLLEGHVKAITAVAWSRNSRYLMSASRDWNVIIWDLATGDRRDTVRFDAPVTSAALHPRNSKMLVVTLQNQAEAVFVDLRAIGGRWELDISAAAALASQEAEPQVNGTESTKGGTRRRESATVCRFNARGDLIFVGSTLGYLYVFETRTKLLVQKEKISGTSSIKDMEFDRRGTSIALNSNDRVIRVFAIDQENGALIPMHRFQDLVNRTPWTGCGFSSDGEYVLGGAGHKSSHQLFIWDKTSGTLAKTLEGPPDPLVDFTWHPSRPVAVTASNIGLIHIWVTSIVERWAAYAPGFEELDENIEYPEKEGEFDFEDVEAQKAREQEEQDIRVDLLQRARSVSPLPIDDFAEMEPDQDDREDFFPTVLDLEEAYGPDIDAEVQDAGMVRTQSATESTVTDAIPAEWYEETRLRRR